MLTDYFRGYGLLAIFVAVAIAVPVGMLLLSYIATFLRIRPSRPTPVKRVAYEGGMKPMSPRPRLFNFRYYNYALLFVVFDVETVFLVPWAVRYGVLSQQFGFFALGAVLVFLAVVTVPYAYAWRKRALEWN
jgi:NADH-quinone oxidoreductase subunit A